MGSSIDTLNSNSGLWCPNEVTQRMTIYTVFMVAVDGMHLSNAYTLIFHHSVTLSVL